MRTPYAEAQRLDYLKDRVKQRVLELREILTSLEFDAVWCACLDVMRVGSMVPIKANPDE